MEQDLFKKLPPEITIDILLRLPLLTTVSCKFVCKPWLDLIKTLEFVKSHLSRSAPALAAFQGETCSKPYRFFEYIDEDGTVHRCNLVFNFSFPHPKIIHSSVDGLLFIFDRKIRPHHLFICNPITRDYIEIPSPQECEHQLQLDTFGFGVSKTSGQYKMVRIYKVYTPTEEANVYSASEFGCQVYTLGTGSWRSISPGALLSYGDTVGVFLDGNFHWLACDSDKFVWISIFDFETELFSTHSSPGLKGGHDNKTLSSLRGSLCLCDNSAEDKIVIWVVKDGANGKYWINEFNIKRWSSNDFYGVLYPIKVFRDGDVLIAKEGCSGLLCYSSKTRTIEETDLIERSGYDQTSAVSYTPSFLRLKTFFPNENISSF